jgi:hypothetical protein
MISVSSFVVRSLCCCVVPLAVASGQRDLKPNLDLSFEVWGGSAEGRVFSHSSGIAGAALSSWHVRNFPYGAVIAGAGIDVHKVITCCADKCVIAIGTPGPCAPDYPAFSSLTGHVGVEGSWGWRVRVIAGPAVFHSASGTAAGLHARGDLATPSFANLALVFSARTARLPRFQGRLYEMSALGIGIRVGN